jgi:protein ImuB
VRRDQLDLFRPAGPAPAVLGETLAALQGLCGAARVGAPVALDTHHPDAFGLVPFAVPPPRDAPDPAAPAVSGALALRALRPPVPAQVRQHRQSPAWIRSAVANGRVVRCAGPWRTTGGWWSPEERFAFDHFDVQSEDGVVVRLRFDHLRREWQIDAIYD